MSRNIPDIEDLFRDSIEPHEELPPETVWTGIDHALDKKCAADTKQKYRRLKLLSAALLLFSLGTIGYELQKNYKQHPGSNNEKRISSLSKNNINRKNGSTQSTQPVVPVLIDKPAEETSRDSNDRTDNGPRETANSQPTGKTQSSAGSFVQRVHATPATNIKNAVNEGEDNLRKASESKSVKNLRSTHSTRNQITEAKIPTNNNRYKSAIRGVAFTKIVRLHPNKAVLDVSTPVQEVVTDRSPANEIVVVNKERGLFPATIERVPDTLVSQVSFGGELPQHGLELSPVALANKNARFPFSLMVYGAPQFNFNRIVDNDDHRMGGQRQNDAHDIKNDENHQRSYAAGLLIDVPLRKRWSVQSGISYINKTVEIEPKRIYARSVNGSAQFRFDFSSGYTYLSAKNGSTPVLGDSVLATESSSNLQYISVPFTINYRFLSGKFNIIPEVGSMVNFLIKEKVVTRVEGGNFNNTQSISAIQGLKKMYFNAITGVTLQYNAGKRLAVTITPSANFALGTINSNAAVKSYPNAFSIAAGMKVYF